MINKGITQRISFEDFVLFPLFLVLIFLSLQICYRKLKKAIGSDEYTCPNRNCIRCRGAAADINGLNKKLTELQEKENVAEDCLSRLREAISGQDAGKKGSNADFHLQKPTVLYLQDLKPASPLHLVSNDVKFLKDHKHLKELRKEMHSVLQKDYLWSKNEVENGEWKLLYFYNQGKKQEENCSHCPKTSNLIQKVSSFMATSPFGNAAFSILSPGTKISAHHGSTNARLRCHITLQKGGHCMLFVGGEKIVYEDDQLFVFDDSFEHHVVHNDGAVEDRIVLMLDLWHPGVTEVERRAIDYIYSM
eukprot:Seg272.7 transcript_id=Seg272.7/GoldUCD/mRNA.D3Y31 product="Aspartate beta-hydroxylase domain-containing protein 2" protein_id=Seg272.7/GoldUCD/D3Y31